MRVCCVSPSHGTNNNFFTPTLCAEKAKKPEKSARSNSAASSSKGQPPAHAQQPAQQQPAWQPPAHAQQAPAHAQQPSQQPWWTPDMWWPSDHWMGGSIVPGYLPAPAVTTGTSVNWTGAAAFQSGEPATCQQAVTSPAFAEPAPPVPLFTMPPTCSVPSGEMSWEPVTFSESVEHDGSSIKAKSRSLPPQQVRSHSSLPPWRKTKDVPRGSWRDNWGHTRVYLQMYIYIYIYRCVCVCVCCLKRGRPSFPCLYVYIYICRAPVGMERGGPSFSLQPVHASVHVHMFAN